MNKKTMTIILVLSHLLCLVLGYCIASIQKRYIEQNTDKTTSTDVTIADSTEQTVPTIEEIIETVMETIEETLIEETAEASTEVTKAPPDLPANQYPSATTPPAIDSPSSQPPATTPPATEPPVTQSPATEPPATNPPLDVPNIPDIDAGDNGTPIG